MKEDRNVPVGPLECVGCCLFAFVGKFLFFGFIEKPLFVVIP